MSLFTATQIAGIDEYELRWGLENVLRNRTAQGKSPTDPEGPAGEARVWAFLAHHARNLYREAVMSLRSAGYDWRQITELLGKLDARDEFESIERVFFSAANSWDQSEARWKCGTCGEWITEPSPANTSGCGPVYDQEGHDPKCERWAAEHTAWIAGRGE